MKNIFNSKIFHFVLRGMVAAIFIGASWYKIHSPGTFAHEIYNYKILPSWAINPAAIVVPWIQFWSGLTILINRQARGGILCLLMMMVTFQIAVASALIRGLNISCGCFKSGGAPASWWTFGRDSLILLAVALMAYFLFQTNGRHHEAE